MSEENTKGHVMSAIRRFFMRDKNIPEPAKEKELTSELVIYFTDGGVYGLGYNGKESGVYPWRYFYKWWFSRKESEFYMLHSKEGEKMIRRSLIASFELRKPKCAAKQ